MTAIMPDNTVSNETKADSVGSMLVNIFLSPMRVFGSIKAKPTWIIPFVITLLAMAGTAYVVAPLAMEMQKQQIMTSDKYTPEQRDQAVQQMETFKGVGAIFGVVGGIVGGAIMVFLMAAIIMFMGSVVFGGSAKFMELVSLVCFTGMISVLGQLVKTPLMMMKQTMDIRTSLAVLLPGSDIKSFAYTILNSLTDVFFVWQIILVIGGVAVLYNFSKGKSAATVLIPVGVIMVIFSAVRAMF
jgi:hypothetical protein